ncbi:ribosome silencing factor [Fibrobacterota bacterium]
MNRTPHTNQTVQKAVEALFMHKIENPVLIDLHAFRNLTYDYLIICTCQSEVQMKAVLNHTRKILRRQGVTGTRIEYSPGVKWGILDCGELIIHTFEKKTRAFYSLERMWSDSKITELHGEDYVTEREEDREEDEYL